MARTRELFHWEYGFDLRHALLLLAVLCVGTAVFTAHLAGSVPSSVTVLAASVSLLTAVVMGRASSAEQFTLAIWGLVAFIGFGVVALLYHLVLLLIVPAETGHILPPIGVALTSLMTVALLLFGLFLVVGALTKALRQDSRISRG